VSGTHNLLKAVCRQGPDSYNPGALRVSFMLGERFEDVVELLERVVKARRTGPKLWMLYKDECGEDLDKLREKILQLPEP
jgi:hypothetical protein